MLDERAAGDPLEGARIMLSGHAEQADAEKDLLRRRYLNAHPSAEAFVSFQIFSFLPGPPDDNPSGRRLWPDRRSQARAVPHGPRRAPRTCWRPRKGAVEHMNSDHRDAMGLYATRLLGADEGDWCCTGCDPEGLDMQDGQATLRLEFPERVTNGTALRKMLVRLAGEAREKTGVSWRDN